MAEDEGESEWDGEFDSFSDHEEKRVLFAALDSFYQYRRLAHLKVTHRRRQAFYALPSAHWQYLSKPPISYLDTLIAIDEAIDTNSVIALSILRTALESFQLPSREVLHPLGETHPLNWSGRSTSHDASKAHTILRQFFRDWSAEGQSERDHSYGPVLADLEAEFPERRNATKVLVPGAGLGRLLFEVCRLGFHSEGNEISYHALFSSSWILNHVPNGKKFELYPWISSFGNQLSRSDQLQCVKIPDVHAGAALAAASDSEANKLQGGVPAAERLAMSAADFSDVYASPDHESAYDAVVTVFFIDTAPNLITYIQTIRHCLKAGGVWINLGPLLWHFGGGADAEGRSDDHERANSPAETESADLADPQSAPKSKPATSDRRSSPTPKGSVELSNDEVLAMVADFGFRVEKQEIRNAAGQGAGYIQQPDSMLQSRYDASHWVARKKEAPV